MSLRIVLSVSLLVLCFQVSLAQWKEHNNGLYGGPVFSVLEHRDTLFATSYGGVYRSVDQGHTWARLNDGIEWDANVYGIFECKGEIIISTGINYQHKLSADKRSWERIRHSLQAPAMIQFTVLDDVIFSVNNQGHVFRSDDLASSWTEITPLPAPAGGIGAHDGLIYISTSKGLYTTDVTGANWTPAGLQTSGNYSATFVRQSGGYLLTGTSSGTYILRPGRTLGNTSLPNLIGWGHAFFADGNNMFVVSSRNTYKSTDGGYTWQSSQVLSDHDVLSGLFLDDDILACTGYGIFRSSDGGTVWTDSNYGLANVDVHGMADHDGKTFLATGRGLYVSTDQGSSWQKTGSDLGLSHLHTVASIGNSIFVGAGDGIYVSRDGGIQWSHVFDDSYITTIGSFKGSVYAGSYSGLFRSDNDGNSWRRVSTADVEDIFVHDAKLWTCGWDDVRFSSDGSNWTMLNAGIGNNPSLRKFFTFGDRLLLGSFNDVPYILNEETNLWEGFKLPFQSNVFLSFAQMGSSLFVGSAHGIFHSPDTMKTFALMNHGLPVYGNNNRVSAMAVKGSTLTAGLDYFGLWTYDIDICANPTTPKAIVSTSTCDSLVLESSAESGNQWFYEGVPLADANGKQFVPKESGHYAVATSAGGCTSDLSEPLDVTMPTPPRVEMPNFFSPNGNNKNEYFLPMMIEGVEAANLRIYNRTGQNIYETTDLSRGWSGEGNASGVYYYKLDYQAPCGTGEVRGWMQLMR